MCFPLSNYSKISEILEATVFNKNSEISNIVFVSCRELLVAGNGEVESDDVEKEFMFLL